MRYPGAKSRLAKDIVDRFKTYPTTLYCEPFLGSGAVAIAYLKGRTDKIKAILTDADPWVIAVWHACVYSAPELQDLVCRFQPSVSAFYKLKHLVETTDPNVLPRAEAALIKLALHAMSYGGLGSLAGSPIGGREQKGKYTVGCRWSPRTVGKYINSIIEACSRHDVVIKVADYNTSLDQLDRCSIAYLDPPYWRVGSSMYPKTFDAADHKRLAQHLTNASFKWWLSYDAAREIRALYEGFSISGLNNTTQHGRQNELLITNT
jgi:DNA adenine methylase